MNAIVLHLALCLTLPSLDWTSVSFQVVVNTQQWSAFAIEINNLSSQLIRFLWEYRIIYWLKWMWLFRCWYCCCWCCCVVVVGHVQMFSFENLENSPVCSVVSVLASDNNGTCSYISKCYVMQALASVSNVRHTPTLILSAPNMCWMSLTERERERMICRVCMCFDWAIQK